MSPEHAAELAQLGADSTGPGGRYIATPSGRLVRLAYDPRARPAFAWHCDAMNWEDAYGPSPRAAYVAFLELRAESLAARIGQLQTEAAEVDLAIRAALARPNPAG